MVQRTDNEIVPRALLGVFLITGLLLFGGRAATAEEPCEFPEDQSDVTEDHVACWVNAAKNGDKTLQNAYFLDADLSGVDLSNADLTNTKFHGANLSGANLSNANLGGADFSTTKWFDNPMLGANLAGANLANADLSGAIFAGANLTSADLTGAKLESAMAALGRHECAHYKTEGIPADWEDRGGHVELIEECGEN